MKIHIKDERTTWTQDVKNISIALFFLVASVAIVLAGKALRSTNAEIHGLVQDIRQDEKAIKPTLQNVNAILLQVGLAADELQDASRKQNAYWDKNSQQISDTVTKVNTLIAHTQTQLDGIGENTQVTLDHLTNRIDDMKVIEYNVDKSVIDLDKLATNPDLTASISNVAKATKGLADSTDSLAKTTADVQTTVHVYTTRLNKPTTFIEKVGTTIGKAVMSASSGIIGWLTK